MSSVWQRGPRFKELQIQELRVQKLWKKGTLTSHVQKQKEQHDHGTKILRSFMPGETVAVRRFWGPDRWQRGVVVQRLGPTTYTVQVANRTLHVHVDHLIPAPEENNTQVTAAHPSLVPDRPTGPHAEARNPAHSLGPTSLEQLSPVPNTSSSSSGTCTRVSISRGFQSCVCDARPACDINQEACS